MSGIGIGIVGGAGFGGVGGIGGFGCGGGGRSGGLVEDDGFADDLGPAVVEGLQEFRVWRVSGSGALAGRGR